MTIIYLHGFRSSPASIKATRLRAAVAALDPGVRPRLHIPDLEMSPAAAIALVVALAEAEAVPGEITFVGSSLGGFYATWLAAHFGARAVCINPAIRPCDDLRSYLGTQVNMYSGKRFEVTEVHFDELRALAIGRLTHPERYFLLVETGDEVLDYRDAVAFYAGAWQFVRGGGDHAFNDFDAQISAILRFAGVATRS